MSGFVDGVVGHPFCPAFKACLEQDCRIKLPAGQKYAVTMINPRTGAVKQLPDADSDVDNRAWQYRQNIESNTVFILKRK